MTLYSYLFIYLFIYLFTYLAIYSFIYWYCTLQRVSQNKTLLSTHSSRNLRTCALAASSSSFTHLPMGSLYLYLLNLITNRFYLFYFLSLILT